jgi:hypothetical protein
MEMSQFICRNVKGPCSDVEKLVTGTSMGIKPVQGILSKTLFQTQDDHPLEATEDYMSMFVHIIASYQGDY